MLIPIKYPSATAILIATGPSLTKEVALTIKKYRHKFVLLGCNDAYQLIPFLDEHYACDDNWWLLRGDDFRRRFPDLSSWTQCPQKEIRERYNVKYTPGKFSPGLSLSNNLIHYGHNSGFQLLNLAYLFGCNKFLLVGYNMKVVDNKKHFFGDHPKGLVQTSPYNRFVEEYNKIQPEIKEKIINCTPDSALTMFKYMDLEEALSA